MSSRDTAKKLAANEQISQPDRFTPFQRLFFDQLANLNAHSKSELIERAKRAGIPNECALAFWKSQEGSGRSSATAELI